MDKCVYFLWGTEDFSSDLCIQIRSEAHPASYSYPMGNGSPFPGTKRGRGVTLTTHPIKCRSQERGAIFLSPLAPARRVAGQLY
jgi:hypothetical protein